MTSNETQISNLLYRYAEMIDTGNLESLNDLFKHANFKLHGQSELQASTTAVAMLKSLVKIYSDGTPRTKHVTTNLIIEVASDGLTATCRSYYTVLQATPDLPLQTIAAGRYYDKFEKIDGTWRFSFRDLSLFDLQGNISQHLNGF